jgi:ubiquinone/menaquinone biosynthesis C-methylase UbiE
LKGKSLIYNQLSKYYDLIYSSKDYKEEARIIKSLIAKFKRSDGTDLLDAACGTGQHISFLKDDFNCMGVDISEKMLNIARKRNPHIRFKKDNMIDMDLNAKFDVITCLFSAIGCVKTYENLRKTWEVFSLHLKVGGIAIVEPWFFLPMHQQKHYFCPDENIQIAKINLATIENNIAFLDFHYLISEKGKKVRYFEDRTELGIFAPDETLKIMKDVGLESHHISKHNIYDEQTFYIGIKK